MEPYIKNLVAKTYFYCPILWILPNAWSSTAGFHHGYIKYNLLATYKFNPA